MKQLLQIYSKVQENRETHEHDKEGNRRYNKDPNWAFRRLKKIIWYEKYTECDYSEIWHCINKGKWT